MRKLDYTLIFVEDLGRSVAFYRGVVGLTLRFQQNGYAEFVGEGSKFALYQKDRVPGLIGRPVGKDAGPRMEIVFRVEDVDTEVRRLKGLGVSVIAGPTDQPWGHRTLHFHDPDGHLVEFAQEIPRQLPPRE
jgi:lactoylglutathione lyase